MSLSSEIRCEGSTQFPEEGLKRIMQRIRSLVLDPRPPGCEKLSGQERYRIRQGTYRIIVEQRCSCSL